MEPNAAPLPPESLLAHTGWMRRLARSLVRDDAQADDVVQDAVLAAIRTPPRDRVALPAWLAATVRNGARQLWRGESRRSARETASVRDAAAPAAAEVVSRAEEHGLVVQAVLALDEPYRSTLLLRFFDDLPPRDVAERLGVPVETVRARVRRGLAQVRERLDRAHGGDGSAWRLALLPLAMPKAAAAAAGAGTGAAAGSGASGLQFTGATIMAGTGTIAAVGAVALVAGAAAGWWFGSSKGEAAAAESAKKLVAAQDEATKSSQSLRARDDSLERMVSKVRDLDQQLRTAKEEAAAAAKQLEETTAALEKAKSERATKPASGKPKTGVRFAFPEYEVLAEIDWSSVAKSLSSMPAIASQLVDAMDKKDQKATMTLMGKLQKENGPLLPVAQALHEKVPGTGYNGPFTNPAFMINAIAATLEAAGKPLSDAQATSAEGIGRKFATEDANRGSQYTPSTFQIQKELDEGDVRHRFFDAVREVLTEDQRAVLWQPNTAGRGALDVFSEGVFLYTVAAPIPYKERSEIATKVGAALFEAIDIPDERREAALEVVRAWVETLPPSLIEQKADNLTYLGGTPTVQLREGLKYTIALLQRLIVDLKLEGAEADAARNCPHGVVPLLQVKN